MTTIFAASPQLVPEVSPMVLVLVQESPASPVPALMTIRRVGPGVVAAAGTVTMTRTRREGRAFEASPHGAGLQQAVP
jgi:hypothetical protein